MVEPDGTDPAPGGGPGDPNKLPAPAPAAAPADPVPVPPPGDRGSGGPSRWSRAETVVGPLVSAITWLWGVTVLRWAVALAVSYWVTVATLDRGLKPALRERAVHGAVPAQWLAQEHDRVPARLASAPAPAPPADRTVTVQDGVEWNVDRPEGRRLLDARTAWLCLVYQCWLLQKEAPAPPPAGGPGPSSAPQPAPQPTERFGPALRWLAEVAPNGPKSADPRRFDPEFLDQLRDRAYDLPDAYFAHLFVHLEGSNYRLVFIDELAELLLTRKEDRDKLLPLIRVYYDRYRRDDAVFNLRVVTGTIQWWTSFAAWLGVLVVVYRFAFGVVPGWLAVSRLRSAMGRGGYGSLTERLDRAAPSGAVGQVLEGARAASAREAGPTELKQVLRADSERVAAHVARNYWVPNFCRWCVPCLGFLGTVVGLSETLMGADGLLTAQNKDAAVQEVTLKLGYKFDTTGVALVWSVFLTLLVLCVSGWEERTVAATEDSVCEYLDGPAHPRRVRFPLLFAASVAALVMVGAVVWRFFPDSTPPPAPQTATVALDLPAEYKAAGDDPGVSIWLKDRPVELGRVRKFRLTDRAFQVELRWGSGPDAQNRLVEVRAPWEKLDPRDPLVVKVPSDFPAERVSVRTVPTRAEGEVTVGGASVRLADGRAEVRASRMQPVTVTAKATGFESRNLAVSTNELPRDGADKALRIVTVKLKPQADPKTVTIWTNPVGIEFRLIHRDGKPPFYIGATEITQKQFQDATKRNPSRFPGGTELAVMPVENLSWVDAAEFCNRLNEADGFPLRYRIDVTGERVEAVREGDHGYRLPTFEEWHAACFHDAPTDDPRWSFGSQEPDRHGWFADRLMMINKPQPVRKKASNPAGVSDMHGNVREWIEDRNNTAGDLAGRRGTIGGSWNEPVLDAAARETDITWLKPMEAFFKRPGDLGFRIVFIPPADK
jgi:hypothetical protein